MQNFNENNNFQRNPEEPRQNNDPQFANQQQQPQQPQQQNMNVYFNKTEFRNMLVNMSEAERAEYESNLSEEFKKSSKMPSVKSKSTLILLAILPLFLPLVINRLYAGRMVSGIIRLLLPFVWIIILIIALATTGATINHATLVGVATAAEAQATSIGWIILTTIGVVTAITSYVWTIVDIVRSVLGKQKDKYGRAIDI